MAAPPAITPAVLKGGPREVAAQAALEVGFGPTSAPSPVRAAARKVFEHAIESAQVVIPKGMAPRPDNLPALPWEDAREMVVPGDQKTTVSAILGNCVFEWGGGSLPQVLSTWSSTTHAHLWSTDLGKAVASFGVQRYGQASLQFDHRGKLAHVVAVLAHADRISLDSAARGQPLDPHWRDLLEYGAFLHDIGYLNGGRFHPKKGANDLLSHFREPSLSQKDLERLSMVVELHGTSFPWDRVDQARLAGNHYVTLDVVEQIFSEPGRMKAFVDALKQDNAEYIAKTGGLAWLDDPQEVRELIRTGWVMHCADNFNGPKTSFAGRDVGKRGMETPLSSLGELEGFVRDRDLRALTARVAAHLSRIVPQDAPRTAAGLDTALERLSSLIDGLTADPPKSSADVARSLRELLATRDFASLDAGASSLDAATAAQVRTASAWPPPSRRGPPPVVVDGPLSAQIKSIVDAVATAVEALPDRRS